MALSTQPYKGTRDFYPADFRARAYMFEKMRKAARSFGYEEYDGPLLESFELYAAKTGEEIVNQQLYWLMDKGERKLAIRPEMTPTLARMVAGKIFELPRPIRWFSIPNLWRYERPQRGRLREHWQLNLDVLGGDPLLADAEILSFAWELMRSFGGEKFVKIRVNHRNLVDYVFTKQMGLGIDQAHALVKWVDGRSKMAPEVFEKGLQETGVPPQKIKMLDEFFGAQLKDLKNYSCDGSAHLTKLFEMLESAGLREAFVFDPSVMRGLDYYTGTVFEMYDVSPENTRAMFGGGRYDNLVGLFGKNALSGVGLGLGDVTLQNFLEIHGLMPQFVSGTDVVVGLPSLELWSTMVEICTQLRAQGLQVATPLSPGGFSDHLKFANKIGARFAVLLGEKELKQKQVAVKNLKSGDQKEVNLDAIAQYILNTTKE